MGILFSKAEPIFCAIGTGLTSLSFRFDVHWVTQEVAWWVIVADISLGKVLLAVQFLLERDGPTAHHLSLSPNNLGVVTSSFVPKRVVSIGFQCGILWKVSYFFIPLLNCCLNKICLCIQSY